MSWIKVFFISIVTLIIEFFFVISLPDQWYQEDNYIIFFAFYQLALIPSVLFLYLKKLETFSELLVLFLIEIW